MNGRGCASEKSVPVAIDIASNTISQHPEADVLPDYFYVQQESRNLP
jgi:hypothetical protein